MSELANIVTVFGAADRAVMAADDETLADVAVVLEPYGSGAAGWFDRFRDDVDDTFHRGLLAIEEALVQLAADEAPGDVDRPRDDVGSTAEPARSPTATRAADTAAAPPAEVETSRTADATAVPPADAATGGAGDAAGAPAPDGTASERFLAAKRIVAIAALVRADPTNYLPVTGQTNAADTLARALLPVMPPDQLESDGLALLSLLAGRRDGTRDEDQSVRFDWQATLLRAQQRGLLDQELVLAAGQCCAASWMTVDVAGQRWPASILETTFSTPAIDLPRLRDYLDPANWPGCCALWCEMRLLNQGSAPSCYREVISLNCPNPWQLRTCLEFVRTNLSSTVVSLEYQLCEDPAHRRSADDTVTVDEGSIVAIQDGRLLRLTSTKRVGFDGYFDAASFAMWACAVGYGDAARDMVFDCACDPQKSPSEPWQPDVPVRRGPRPAGGGTQPTTAAIDHAVDVMVAGVQSSADSFKDLLVKVSSKTCTAEDIITGSTDMWTRAARSMLRLCSPQLADNAPRTVRSRRFTDIGPDGNMTRLVTVDEPLINGFGDTISTDALSVEPAVLDPGREHFRVAARITNERAGVYRGSATVTTRTTGGRRGTNAVSVPVWLQVS